jgi:predicted short-subunit dehydrogenase-like oxidoreductase (DUF2520 family)
LTIMNKKKPVKDGIAILGLGKVGTAIGYLLKEAGYRILAVASRSQSSLNYGVTFTGGQPFTNYSQAAAQADCIIITTPDDAILPACIQIVKSGGVKPRKKVIHMSGARGLDLLDPAKNAGAYVASIHPLQSFADVRGAISNIPGSTFGITAQDEIKDWSVQMVKNIGGVPFFVSDEEKPLYHAAACIASNYLTTLLFMVEEILMLLGLTRKEAEDAFWPLVMGTISNIEQKGAVSALTGPISRGDTGTIRKHLVCLQQRCPDYLRPYCEMGIIAADVGVMKKTVTEKEAENIKNILRKGLEYE